MVDGFGFKGCRYGTAAGVVGGNRYLESRAISDNHSCRPREVVSGNGHIVSGNGSSSWLNSLMAVSYHFSYRCQQFNPIASDFPLQ